MSDEATELTITGPGGKAILIAASGMYMAPCDPHERRLAFDALVEAMRLLAGRMPLDGATSGPTEGPLAEAPEVAALGGVRISRRPAA